MTAASDTLACRTSADSISALPRRCKQEIGWAGDKHYDSISALPRRCRQAIVVRGHRKGFNRKLLLKQARGSGGYR